MPSPNDNDGKPNTPPPSSLPATHHRTAVRQLTIKPPDGRDAMEKLWSTQDLADFLGLPVQTIYQWRKRNYGPPGRKMGRHVR
ncbi:MAG: helix-turn-helix transcriptional regulator, partial [Pseudonocardiaceae bacterium]